MIIMKGILPVIVFLVSALLILGPCDETLPPYTEPEVFLEGAITGQYLLSVAFGNRVSVQFSVKNIYEETLDETVQMRGFIELRSVRRPDIKKTFSLTGGNVILGGYNRQTGQLTINPQDSIVFSVSWDVSTDDRGVDPRGELFTFYEDPICSLRCIAVREDFILSGEVHVFNQRAPVKATAMLPLCYVSAVVTPAACITVQTDPPCITQADPFASRCYPF